MNNTGGYLWFQTECNDQAARLSFRGFGEARDFTVEIGISRTLSTTPAPPDRIIRTARSLGRTR